MMYNKLGNQHAIIVAAGRMVLVEIEPAATKVLADKTGSDQVEIIFQKCHDIMQAIVIEKLTTQLFDHDSTMLITLEDVES